MASPWPDDYIPSDRFIERRYVQIPKDQQPYLEKAWSETLSRGQYPMLNVPTSVLQDVKDLHTRRNAKPTQQSASSAQWPSTASSARLPPRPSTQEQPTSSPQRDDDVELPWGSSPEHHFRPRSDLKLPPSIPCQPSSPPKSSPMRKIPYQFINDEPQSSGANSEGLEIDPPGYVTQHMEPSVNRAASRVFATGPSRPEPTPPSAQMPIGTGKRVTNPPPAKRRRVVEDIGHTSYDPVRAEPVGASKYGQKPDSIQNSLTTTTSAASLSLGTHFARDKTTQAGEPNVMSDPGPFSNLTPTFEGRRRDTAAQHLVITETPIPGPSFGPPPAQQDTAVKSESHTQLLCQQRLQQQSRASPVPSYDTFKLAYPDYSRSCRDFVIALLSVKQLRRNKEIHESLYDDFIRAYSSDYFGYVSECSRKRAKEILPGIQWYNDTVEVVLYSRNIVRKNNLDDFLNTHAEEAHSIRRILGDSQSTESIVEDHNTDREDALDEDEDIAQESHEQEVTDLALVDAESPASPELYMRSPGPVTKSTQLPDRTPVRVGELTGTAGLEKDMEQVREQTEDLTSEEDVWEPLVEADSSRRSPEFHTESPSAAKATAASNSRHTSQAPKSPTPTLAESFASQENGLDLLRPISPSRPRLSKLAGSQCHDEEPNWEASQVSPPQRAADLSSSNRPGSLLSGDNDHEDEKAEEPVEPQAPPPPQPEERSVSSKTSRISSVDKDAHDDNAFAYKPLVSPPLRTAGSTSVGMPGRLSVNDGHDVDTSATPKPPSQRDGKSLSTNKPLHSSTDGEESDAFEPPMSPLGQAVKTLPQSRFKRFPVDEEGDTDGDTLKPPSPKNMTESVLAPEPRPTSSAATRPTRTSKVLVFKPSSLSQKSVTGPKKSVARPSTASSVNLGAGWRPSATPSVGSSIIVPRSKKRSSEAPEKRSSRLKAFMEEQMEKRRRLSSETPASTSVSKG